MSVPAAESSQYCTGACPRKQNSQAFLLNTNAMKFKLSGMTRLEAFHEVGTLIDFLRVPKENFLLAPRARMAKNRFNFVHFVEAANAMANSIRDKRECLSALCFSYRRPSLDFPTKPFLVFKSTGGKRPRGHVTDTECRSDITAAFDKDWGKDGTTLRPCIRLADENASKGKS